MASGVAVVLSLFGYAANHSGMAEGVFLLVPFCTGLAIAFMSRGQRVVAITALTSLWLSLVILLLTGLEGIGCILMALPILLIGIGAGAATGYFLGKKFIRGYGSVSVVAFCLAAMGLVGWTNEGMSDAEVLTVRTRVVFAAPMAAVWNAVTESGVITGDDTALRMLGLPVPLSCSLDGDGTRTCFFEEGAMVQKVTADDYGRLFSVEITEPLAVRDWLSFVDARYEFVGRAGGVEVVRSDTIESRLAPRWYWRWFEEQCVRLEHRYVLRSMKASAEGA